MMNAGRKYRAIFLYLYFGICILIFKYLQMEIAEQGLTNANNITHVIHHCSYFSFPKDVCFWKVVFGVISKEHLTSPFFSVFFFSFVIQTFHMGTKEKTGQCFLTFLMKGQNGSLQKSRGEYKLRDCSEKSIITHFVMERQ